MTTSDSRLSDAAGGETGIRTLEAVSRLHAFQACAFDRSATSPRSGTLALITANLKRMTRLNTLFCIRSSSAAGHGRGRERSELSRVSRGARICSDDQEARLPMRWIQESKNLGAISLATKLHYPFEAPRRCRVDSTGTETAHYYVLKCLQNARFTNSIIVPNLPRNYLLRHVQFLSRISLIFRRVIFSSYLINILDWAQ